MARVALDHGCPGKERLLLATEGAVTTPLMLSPLPSSKSGNAGTSSRRLGGSDPGTAAGALSECDTPTGLTEEDVTAGVTETQQTQRNRSTDITRSNKPAEATAQSHTSRPGAGRPASARARCCQLHSPGTVKGDLQLSTGGRAHDGSCGRCHSSHSLLS